jgi:hypothetical protein
MRLAMAAPEFSTFHNTKGKLVLSGKLPERDRYIKLDKVII